MILDRLRRGHPRGLPPDVRCAFFRPRANCVPYAGQAAVGITADFASVPEADDFAAAIVDEVARLRAAVPRAVTASKPVRRRAASAARTAELA